jgi:hypothetical protein
VDRVIKVFDGLVARRPVGNATRQRWSKSDKAAAQSPV